MFTWPHLNSRGVGIILDSYANWKSPGWICVAMLWPDLNWFIVNKYHKSYFADENIPKEISRLTSVLLLLLLLLFVRLVFFFQSASYYQPVQAQIEQRPAKKKKDRLKSALLVDPQVRRHTTAQSHYKCEVETGPVEPKGDLCLTNDPAIAANAL